MSLAPTLTTYTTPPTEPSASGPTEPVSVPNEPDGSLSLSTPSKGAREASSLQAVNAPTVWGASSFWPRTPAAVDAPVSVIEPWYATLNQSYLPIVFQYRVGASPSLRPWGGVSVYSDPHGGNVETGTSYRATYMTPILTLDSLTRLKRVFGVSGVANGFGEVVAPAQSADSNEWGEVRFRALLNTSLTHEYQTSETNYNVFRTEAGTSSYVFHETLKDVDHKPQAMFWSSDEGAWKLEGFQVDAENKGERFGPIYGGF